MVVCCSCHDHPCTLHFLPAEPHLMTDSHNFIRLYSKKNEYEASEWAIQKSSALQAFFLRQGYCQCHALVFTCILLPIALRDKHLPVCCIPLHVLGSSTAGSTMFYLASSTLLPLVIWSGWYDDMYHLCRSCVSIYSASQRIACCHCAKFSLPANLNPWSCQ